LFQKSLLMQEQNLLEIIHELRKTVRVLQNTVAELQLDNHKLKEENTLLKQENILLKQEVATLKNRLNSGNSSLPPSSDLHAKNKSLRPKGDKKSGGQPGHKGKTLEMKAIPDQIISHIPDFCACCGDSLSQKEAHFLEKRQVVDLPPIVPHYYEYQIFSKTCACGKTTKGSFPQEVTAPIQYGSNVETLVVYFSVRQYMPFQRIAEYFNNLGIFISEGTIANILERMARKCAFPYQVIKDNIEKSTVVGADETGTKIDGKKGWIHTYQNPLNTLIIASPSRGSTVQETEFPNGFPNATFISDAWPAQLKTPAKNHQLCIPHLIRDLNFFIEAFEDDWAKRVKELFLKSIRLKPQILDYQSLNPQRQALFDELDELLRESQKDKHKKINAFYKRLIKNRNSLLNFLLINEVPPDNNGSERAIRNIKVKTKISGQFKSFNGARIFAVIRSVIDTMIKRNQNVFTGLGQVANYIPE